MLKTRLLLVLTALAFASLACAAAERLVFGNADEGVAAPADESDDDVLRQYLCIHFPHKLSPIMAGYLGHRVIAGVLSQIIGANVKCMQSMLFIKASGKPGQAWHQDEYFIPTRDRSLTGGWIAMDDATVENGCLWVIPGSHKHGLLWPQHEHDVIGGVRLALDCAGVSRLSACGVGWPSNY